MMRNNMKKYIAISILPVLILIYISITPIITNKTGKEITVGARVFYDTYGEESYIEYDIQKISLNKTEDVYLKYKNDYEKLEDYINKDIYVVLKENNNKYEVDYASFDKPGDDEIYLKAKTSHVITDDKFNNETEATQNQYLWVRYTLIDNVSNNKLENIGTTFSSYERGTPVNADIKVNKGYAIFTKVWAE